MQEPMEEPHRIRKVRQSMKAIKVVLGERYRAFKTASQTTHTPFFFFLVIFLLLRVFPRVCVSLMIKIQCIDHLNTTV